MIKALGGSKIFQMGAEEEERERRLRRDSRKELLEARSLLGNLFPVRAQGSDSQGSVETGQEASRPITIGKSGSTSSTALVCITKGTPSPRVTGNSAERGVDQSSPDGQ